MCTGYSCFKIGKFCYFSLQKCETYYLSKHCLVFDNPIPTNHPTPTPCKKLTNVANGLEITARPTLEAIRAPIDSGLHVRVAFIKIIETIPLTPFPYLSIAWNKIPNEDLRQAFIGPWGARCGRRPRGSARRSRFDRIFLVCSLASVPRSSNAKSY